jgi:protein-disulfide isomerase
MDEETKHRNKKTEDDISNDNSFDRAVEEASGENEAEEAPQNTMQYVVLGLAVLILLLNIYSIAQINDLGGKINSINKVTGLVAYNGSSGNNPTTLALSVVSTTEQSVAVTTTLAAGTQKVNVLVLSDKRCTDCSFTDDVITQLIDVFPGLTATKIDYGTTEGKKLFSDAQLKYMPAILFSEDAKTAPGYSDIADYLEPAGIYQSLRIGAQFEPSCYNVDGTIDCVKCASKTECRPEKKNDMQVFIMSDCPYGRQAIQALKPVVDNFGDAITWDVHYIASETNNGTFSSLHGQYEVDEDIVQLCVKEYSPDEFLDYLFCRSTSGVKGIDWHTCATDSGISSVAIKTIEKCANGTKGKELLSKDIMIADALGVGGSPTWMANNRYQFGGIDSETVKTNLCKYNAGLSGCDVVLNSSTGGLAAAGSC